MKKFLTFALTFMMVGTVCFAQDNNKGERPQKKNYYWEQMQVEKVGFITQKLDLTVEEAQVFWPVYNKYQKECAETGKALRQATKALRPQKDVTPSEKEITEQVNAYLKAKKEADSVLEEYSKEFLKILPAAKVAKLIIAEEQFKKVAFEKFAGRKPNPQHPHDGAPAGGPVKPQQKPQPKPEMEQQAAPVPEI